MRKFILLIPIFFCFNFLNSCSEEEQLNEQIFVAAFEKQSIDFSRIEDNEEIKLVFSKAATADGLIEISISNEHANYDVDYNTLPLATSNKIEIPYYKGNREVAFKFHNLIYPFDRSDKFIQFQITKITTLEASNIQGYDKLKISFERSVGGTISPEVGGPNQPFQVYVDLSKDYQSKYKRDLWDLGFYNGNANRVVLNGSVYMAAKELDVTDINSVNTQNVRHLFSTVAVGTFNDANKEFIDFPSGDITKTAIAEIKENNDLNKVYLLNLGYEVGTMVPSVGSVAIAGNERGWKKVRFLLDNNKYKMQYANLDDTTFQELEISKNEAYNFTHFSFTENRTVTVQPPKTDWDLNFTVFTNLISGNGSYGFSDYVLNNIHGGVKVYRVNVNQNTTYENFTEANINENLFENDQRTIGDSWRQVTEPQTLFTDRFYILKDAENNYYKLRMLAFLNSSGLRGYPKFEYQLLK